MHCAISLYFVAIVLVVFGTACWDAGGRNVGAAKRCAEERKLE